MGERNAAKTGNNPEHGRRNRRDSNVPGNVDDASEAPEEEGSEEESYEAHHICQTCDTPFGIHPKEKGQACPFCKRKRGS